jgi:hypothetical protein
MKCQMSVVELCFIPISRRKMPVQKNSETGLYESAREQSGAYGTRSDHLKVVLSTPLELHVPTWCPQQVEAVKGITINVNL